MKTLVEIEITRHNVTPAQFLTYVRATLNRKGVRDYGSDLDLDYFVRGNDLNFEYRNNPEKPCKAEKSVSHPYEMQTFVLNWDGSRYNEICEFEFDDEKTGHGYYYLVNTEAEPTEESKEENEMSTNELTALCTEYKELQRLREEITAEMETISDTIKAAMGTTEKMVAGQYKILYTTVNGSRLDTTGLKKALPEIAARFTVSTSSRRFTIN